MDVGEQVCVQCSTLRSWLSDFGACLTSSLMDVVVQDGRYIGGYAYQYPRQNTAGIEQHLYFYRHFQRMTDDLGHLVSALTSLYMPHYLRKVPSVLCGLRVCVVTRAVVMSTGLYTTTGSETAQGLPNAPLFLAFDRSACKQYAAKWYCDAFSHTPLHVMHVAVSMFSRSVCLPCAVQVGQ
jgi:hypothetical protein